MSAVHEGLGEQVPGPGLLGVRVPERTRRRARGSRSRCRWPARTACGPRCRAPRPAARRPRRSRGRWPRSAWSTGLSSPPKSRKPVAWMPKFTATSPTIQKRPWTMRRATRPMPAARHTRIGLNSRRNCGTPKVNSPCGARRPWSVSQPHTRCAPRPQRPSVVRTPASASTSQAASPVKVAPRIMSMWVGLHMVTSTPYSACHTSSRGKPDTAPRPSAHMRDQRRRHAERAARGGPRRPRRSRRRCRAPPTPGSSRGPTRIPLCGAVRRLLSRPRAMCQATSE